MLIMSLPAAVNLIWDKREHSLPAVGTLIRFRRTAALDVAVALNRRGHCLSVGTFGTSLGNDMLKCFFDCCGVESEHSNLPQDTALSLSPSRSVLPRDYGTGSIYMYPSLCHSKNKNVKLLDSIRPRESMP
jgi:hypothetical protein